MKIKIFKILSNQYSNRMISKKIINLKRQYFTEI
jgi:hypothetical protein